MLPPPPTQALRLVDSRWLTPSVRHFVFERSDGTPLPFLPGQFMRVRISTGESPEFRSYSIANPNDPGRSDAQRIELVVSLVEGGLGSGERARDPAPGVRNGAVDGLAVAGLEPVLHVPDLLRNRGELHRGRSPQDRADLVVGHRSTRQLR